VSIINNLKLLFHVNFFDSELSFVKVLRPTRVKIGHFWNVLLASIEETKSNTTKANIHLEHRNTTTQNKHKKLKPGLVALYKFRREKGAGPTLLLPGPANGM